MNYIELRVARDKWITKDGVPHDMAEGLTRLILDLLRDYDRPVLVMLDEDDRPQDEVLVVK